MAEEVHELRRFSHNLIFSARGEKCRALIDKLSGAATVPSDAYLCIVKMHTNALQKS